LFAGLINHARAAASHLVLRYVARASVALLSDWFPKTTGELLHVDGGFHATGA